jgi:hypothetical protein
MSAPDSAGPDPGRAIARHDLPGSSSRGIGPVAEPSWFGLLGTLTYERLTGLAVAAADAGQLQLPEGQSKQLLELHKEVMFHALRMESRLVELAASFDAAGVDMVVLKGSALAHSVYPDPSWRPFGDTDLLVRTRDWETAFALLAEAGFSPKFPEPRPGFRARFGHTACHVDDAGFELDLHRTLVAGPFGLWMDPEELFDHTAKFELGGSVLHRLDDSAAFVHACLHAALGHRPPLLMPVRDVAQLVSRPTLDWTLLADWASRWKVGVVIEHALTLAAEILGWEAPETAEELIRSQYPSRRARRALEAYTTDRRSRGGIAFASVPAIRGVRSKAAYVYALTFPNAEFLAFRENGTGARSMFTRWSKPGRWFARRP